MAARSKFKLFVLIFSCYCAPAPTSSQNVPHLGSVVELPDSCPVGPIAGTTCRQLRVSCPGLRPIAARVRITEPTAGVPFRGTVVLGSGGDGAEF